MSRTTAADAPSEIDKPEIDAAEVAEYLAEFGFRPANPSNRNSAGLEQNTPATHLEISQSIMGSDAQSGLSEAGPTPRPRTKRLTSTADRRRAKTEVTQVLPIVPDSSRLADPSSQ